MSPGASVKGAWRSWGPVTGHGRGTRRQPVPGVFPATAGGLASSTPGKSSRRACCRREGCRTSSGPGQ